MARNPAVGLLCLPMNPWSPDSLVSLLMMTKDRFWPKYCDIEVFFVKILVTYHQLPNRRCCSKFWRWFDIGSCIRASVSSNSGTSCKLHPPLVSYIYVYSPVYRGVYIHLYMYTYIYIYYKHISSSLFTTHTIHTACDSDIEREIVPKGKSTLKYLNVPYSFLNTFL